MAKKNLKGSFADELRSAAYVWLGNTNIDSTHLLLINFNKTTHWVLVENNDDNIVLKAPKETTALSQEIFTALYEIHPVWKKKETGTINTSVLPKGLSILSDNNDTFYKRGIKPLKQTTVIPFLDNLGINVTMYEYTKLSIDNSHTLTQDWVIKGYTNYSSDVLSIMVDTSKYKIYTMDKQDEYEMMDMGCFQGIIAAGPAGTGKSTDPLIYCAKEEIPVVVFQCTPGTEEDAIIGNFIPNNSGGFSLKRGPLANAIEQDCWLVINEANYVPSGILSCLNSVMDDNAQVLLDDGTMLKRGKNFRLILTVNPGYRGTNMFNEATLNRFATVYYEPITKKILIERLKQESGYKNEKVLEAVAEQFDKLRGIYQSKNMETEVTFRNALRFLKMILLAPEKSIEKQFDMAFVNNAIFEMNDIQVELNDLKEIRKDMLSDIKSALAEGTEEVTEASWTCSPQVNIDDLTSQIGDDGSFLDVEEDE
jgi:MoxR-like ATPase